jgi:threonine dehydratase
MRTCDEIGQAHPGAVFVHPFDNPDVIAGQGTLGIEFMEQTNNELDAMIVPVGGGGLASGVALAVKHLKPEIAVFAAEPEGADDTYRSFQQGARVLSHREGLPNSIADGLLTINSDRTFRILKGTLHGVLRVSEDQIRHAMYLVYERCKLVIEPSAAVGVAAVLACPEALAPYKRVGIVICGGNVDISSISSLAKLWKSPSTPKNTKKKKWNGGLVCRVWGEALGSPRVLRRAATERIEKMVDLMISKIPLNEKENCILLLFAFQ